MRSRAFAANRFRRSIALEVFKQSALSLFEHRVDIEPLVELAEFELELVELAELADEQLASELVDFAIVLIAADIVFRIFVFFQVSNVSVLNSLVPF